MLTINRDSPHKLYDYFDMIGETSTPLNLRTTRSLGQYRTLTSTLLNSSPFIKVSRVSDMHRIIGTSSTRVVIFSDSQAALKALTKPEENYSPFVECAWRPLDPGFLFTEEAAQTAKRAQGERNALARSEESRK